MGFAHLIDGGSNDFMSFQNWHMTCLGLLGHMREARIRRTIAPLVAAAVAIIVVSACDLSPHPLPPCDGCETNAGAGTGTGSAASSGASTGPGMWSAGGTGAGSGPTAPSGGSAASGTSTASASTGSGAGGTGASSGGASSGAGSSGTAAAPVSVEDGGMGEGGSSSGEAGVEIDATPDAGADAVDAHVTGESDHDGQGPNAKCATDAVADDAAETCE